MVVGQGNSLFERPGEGADSTGRKEEALPRQKAGAGAGAHHRPGQPVSSDSARPLCVALGVIGGVGQGWRGGLYDPCGMDHAG